MRKIELPASLSGRLYLHSMPGRNEPFEEIRAAIAVEKIACVICLAPRDEIRRKSPEYHTALAEGVPWRHVGFPIGDFGVPDDRNEFWALAQHTATALRAGERILIHCGAGVGRTGTLAVAVLLALNYALSDAIMTITAAGSHPETDAQKDLLHWIAAGAHRED